MSNSWLRRPAAFGLYLFLPWFPLTVLTTPSPTAESALADETKDSNPSDSKSASEEEPLVLPGVVIEEIPRGLALEKAKLQVGDVILSWERLPNPPANPEASHGVITSYFDWQYLRMEQVSRGTVVLHGRRDGKALDFKVEPGVWDSEEQFVRPVLPRLVEDNYNAGKAMLAAGDVEGAVQTWKSIANHAMGEDGGELRAWVALLIADARGKVGDWGRAEDACREALEGTENHWVQVDALFRLCDLLEKQSKYKEAEKIYGTALKAAQANRPKSLEAARIINSLGFVAWIQEDLNRAQSLIQEALDLQEQLAPQSLVVAGNLNNLGILAQERGEVGRAQEYILKAVKIQERLAPQSLDLANSLNSLGMVAWNRGELDQAANYFLQSLRVHEQFPHKSLAAATNLSNIGAVTHARGEFDRASDYYNRALIIQQQLSPRSPEVARSLNNLGSLAQNRGELGRAYDYYSQSLQLEEQIGPQGLRAASCLRNMGALLSDLGELDRSSEYFLRALAIQEKLAPRSLVLANTLSSLGGVAQEKGALHRAQEYYRQALQIAQELATESLVEAAILSGLGSLAWSRGDLDKAYSDYTLALKFYDQLAPKNRGVTTCLKNLGDVARARGALGQAREYYSRALDAFEYQVSRLGGSYEVQVGFRVRFDALFRAMLSLILSESNLTEAFDTLERFRAKIFLTMLTERDTIFSADIPEELDRERRRLGVQYDRTLKKLAGLTLRDHSEEIEAIRRELRKLDDETGEIETRIRKASPRLAALKYPHPLGAADVQQALDPGTVLLSFSVGKENTTLFVLSRSGALEVKPISLTEEALRSQVKQLLSLIRETEQGSSLGPMRRHRLQAASRELYAALLGPVEERIAASERLLILPDGPLHALPFAALVRDQGAGGTMKGPQYLADWKPIHIALSATVFAELKQKRRPAGEGDSAQAPIQIAAFGDPVYPQRPTEPKVVPVPALPAATGVIAQVEPTRGDPVVRSAAERGVFDWQPLPYTRREVEGIACLFPAGSARTFLGPQALEERIKDLDPKTRILHLAAHSYTDEHLPSSWFVALTIPEDTTSEAVGPERDNGLLQVWEIFERVRIDADLVVLSACDTGLGEEQGGEGLIGLTRAFQYAGARSVMASLWSVQDQATSELMIRFYKHFRAGLTKDEALRHAQMELIRGPIEITNEKGEKVLFDASSPYYWAGFQVYGDWQ